MTSDHEEGWSRRNEWTHEYPDNRSRARPLWVPQQSGDRVFAHTGNYQETARRLGIDRRTVKEKIDPALLGAAHRGSARRIGQRASGEDRLPVAVGVFAAEAAVDEHDLAAGYVVPEAEAAEAEAVLAFTRSHARELEDAVGAPAL